MTNPQPAPELAPTVPPPPAMLPHELPAEARERLAAEAIEKVLKRYNVTIEKLVIWPNEGRPYADIRTKAIG